MNNKLKLEIAKLLLNDIVKNWNEEEVLKYDSKISFDELVYEVKGVFLK